MLAIASLLFLLGLSMLVTRIATVALSHTGMTTEMARFQARSAFTGVGFTTTEAESVVKHPVRRRIVMLLMLLGNVGIISVLGSLVIGFVGDSPSPWWVRLTSLTVGLSFLLWLANSKLVDRALHRLINRLLTRFTDLYVRDYVSLLRLAGDYTVMELEVEEGDWLCERTLADLALRDEGVIVLGIERGDGGYRGAPNGDTRIHEEDRLLLYGRDAALEDLDQRRRDQMGEVRHAQAVREHAERVEREREEDQARAAATEEEKGETAEDAEGAVDPAPRSTSSGAHPKSHREPPSSEKSSSARERT